MYKVKKLTLRRPDANKWLNGMEKHFMSIKFVRFYGHTISIYWNGPLNLCQMICVKERNYMWQKERAITIFGMLSVLWTMDKGLSGIVWSFIINNYISLKHCNK